MSTPEQPVMAVTRNEQAVTQGPPICGHHRILLTYIDTPNPDAGEPWGWRCPSCFPEVFPGYRPPEQRLREVQAVVALMESDLADRHFYSGDPDHGGTRAMDKWCKELRAAIAVHRPSDASTPEPE